MPKSKIELSKIDTYVFIDVSNIRSACLNSCGFRLDFKKLIKYLQLKYKRLKTVKYFEGVSDDDVTRKKLFKQYQKLGYQIRTLSRKAYTDPAIYKDIVCKKCKTPRRIRIQSKSKKLKSNVDVYVATELLETAFYATKPTHIILMACDGDYAEMIRSAITKNKLIHITVLATPTTKKNNALSVRLKQLRSELPHNYLLRSIIEIKDKVS